MSVKFRQCVRLRSRPEFDAVQKGGRRQSTRLMTLVARPNALDRDRLGIVASRRIGGAVVRNRAKRRLREVFRRLEPDRALARGERPLDVVAIARQELTTVSLAVVETDFCAALRKLRSAK
jgi:ribonuclease P protein component